MENKQNLSCKFCGKMCKSLSGLTYHQNRCESNPDKKVTKQKLLPAKRPCKYCDREFNTEKGLKLHEPYCDKNKDRKYINPKLTIINKDCQYCGKTIKNLSRLSFHERSCNKNPNKINIKYKRKLADSGCNFCGMKFDTQNGVNIHKHYCKYNPDFDPGKIIHTISPHASSGELSVHKFISGITKDKPITCLHTSKRIEYDICVEHKKILIEFNGTYWHSSKKDVGVSSDQHKLKTDIAEKLGYKLFHISEHDWFRKMDIWKSMLNVSIMCTEKVTSIYARSLVFREFKNKEARKFLDENHMQGFRRASKAYGLFDAEGGLISMMSFSFNAHYKCQELIRFSTLKNTIVVGGVQKLFKNYLKVTDEKSIVSYARRDWSSKLDNVYQRLGFEEIGITPPGYQYVHPTKLANGKFETHIKSRQAFQKHKLLMMIDEGTMKRPEGELTERTIAEHNGWYRFYDAGNLIYKYNL